MDEYTVSSELYAENNYATCLEPHINKKNIVSVFPFKSLETDDDGDLIVVRKSNKVDEYNNELHLEHSKATTLQLVGTQIWRGAFLLADWLISNRNELPDGKILELGAGVGLSSIIAAMFRPVICTDINLGDILPLLESNIKRNSKFVKHEVHVKEIDFMACFSNEIIEDLKHVRLIIAADVVYDNKLTDAFINTVEALRKHTPQKTIIVALEKRFVFTMAECDTWAPCYEYLIDQLHERSLHFDVLQINFPQYFRYERVKQLVLLRL